MAVNYEAMLKAKIESDMQMVADGKMSPADAAQKMIDFMYAVRQLGHIEGMVSTALDVVSMLPDDSDDAARCANIPTAGNC